MHMRRLLELVTRWGEDDFGGEIAANESRLAASYELAELLKNFKKMLVALRFGKDAWAKGYTPRVQANNFDALELITATGNARGLGVVMNNMA